MDQQAQAARGHGRMTKIAFLIGLAATLLGGLWMLQGPGLVQLRPILCFADCVPLQGASAAWFVMGAVMLAPGAGAVVCSLRRPLR